MKNKLLSILTVLFVWLLTSNNTQAQTLFQKKYSTTTGVDGIYSGLASGNGIIVCGKTTTSPYDAIILKTDLNGVVQWGKKIGGTQDDVFHKIKPTSDGGYIAVGYTKSSGAGDKDVLLVKLDQNGGITWSKTYGTSDIDVGYDVIQTSDGGYAICGYAKKKELTTTDGAVYIIKTNNLGVVTWSKMMGADSQYNGTNIFQNADGDLICMGTGASQTVVLLKISISGTIAWVRMIRPNNLSGISCHQMIQTSDGGYAMIGCGPNPSNKDCVGLICLDADGATNFCRIYSGDIGFNTLPPGFQQTWDNGFLITTSDPGYDLVMLKVSNTGTVTKATTFNTVSPNGSTNMYMSKISNSIYSFASNINNNVLLSKFDWEGNSGCNISTLVTSSSSNLINNQTTDWASVGTATSNSITLTTSSLTFTSSNLCSTSVGLDENATNNEIFVYPNPFNTSFNIELQINYPEVEVTLFDMLSRKVYSQKFNEANWITVPRNNLNSGVYFYKISAKQKIISSGKIIAE